MRAVKLSRFPWAADTKHSPVYPNHVDPNPYVSTYQQPIFTAGSFEQIAEGCLKRTRCAITHGIEKRSSKRLVFPFVFSDMTLMFIMWALGPVWFLLLWAVAHLSSHTPL